MTVRQSWAARQREANRFLYGVNTTDTATARAIWEACNPGVADLPRVNPPKFHTPTVEEMQAAVTALHAESDAKKAGAQS